MCHEDHMSRKSILIQIHKDLVAGNLKLPTLPEIGLKIKDEAKKPDTDIHKLTKIAESDPAFCGYILQISNSPIYRGNTSVQKVNLAIGRLGLENTRNIAMTFAVRALYRNTNKQAVNWLKNTWKDSTYTAAVSSVIAEHVEQNFDPDEAILAGLLQDIGCLPLIEKASTYPELIEEPQAMQWLFDRYAATLGSTILSRWGLESKFVSVAKNRNNWKYNDELEVNLTDIVLMAKLHTYLGRKTREPMPRINQTPSFIKLSFDNELSPEKSIKFIADAKIKILETQRALSG